MHAWGAAGVLVEAHDDGGVVVLVELAHAQKALHLHLVLNYASYLRIHQIPIDQLHFELYTYQIKLNNNKAIPHLLISHFTQPFLFTH